MQSRDQLGLNWIFRALAGAALGKTKCRTPSLRAASMRSRSAKVDTVDQAYYKAEVEPLLDDPLIEFIGEIGDDEKGAFLGDATALLFPIDWPEPFGLAMIEAMASGTPVIVFRRGSVPEVIEPGVTGIIDEAVAAIPATSALDRSRIRRRFEERFSVDRMARDYLDPYSEVLHRGAAADAGRKAVAAKAADDD